MKNVVAKRRLNKRKVFFTRVSLIVLVILLVMTVKVSFQQRKIKTSSYLGNKVASSSKKHKASSVKKNTVVLKNQISNDGTNAEDALKEDGKKTVYLTFDDGPSTTVTPKILDILKANGVHATFFLVGHAIEGSSKAADLVRRAYNEGNAIGDHTYSHDMKKLYRYNGRNVVDVDAFMNEVDRTQSIIKNILGPTFFTRIVRMPGGHMSRVYYKDPNLPQLDSVFRQRNLVSVDWNAYDHDAEGRKEYSGELFNHVKNEVGNHEKAIILMHDTYGKEETAKALPNIIQYLKAQGYEFGTLK
ncbi:polysaccharide deacetylase family protein [Clostridium neuense]|uniref:Polysaccharide deacetylase family protein n=1 Tax=Clostridium neuense TaxID=1728934 RepID=A0ABW8TGB4_9CLOT